MLLDYSSIELEGIKVFEKVSFQNHGRVEKMLNSEACFMFVLQGHFEIRTPIKQLAVSKNEGFLTKCGDYFFEDINQYQEDARIVEAVAVYFHPTIIRQLFSTSPVQNKTHLTAKVVLNEGLQRYKESLIYYVNHPQLFSTELQLLKIKELVLLLFETSDSPSFDAFISGLFSSDDYEFTQVVESNCTSSISNNELAYLCHVSIATFKRKFKEYYNDTPSNYRKKRKLKMAESLLISSSLRINEIAFNCGFDTVSTFNRSFKAQYNQSPTDFRLSQIA